MSDPESWTSVLRDFGLPTFLLLLFVALGLLVLRRAYPLATALVQTHIAFVKTMELESQRWAKDAQDWREYLKERDSVQSRNLRELRDEIQALRSSGGGTSD